MTTPAIRSQVPLLHVGDVARTIRFYDQLGFVVANSVTANDGTLQWVWLVAGSTSLMFARTEEPVVPGAQRALLYLYADDVAAMHAHLRAHGVDVGPIQTPFYSPRGEFRFADPDGWGLVVAHT